MNLKSVLSYFTSFSDGSSAASTNYTPFATSGKSNNKKSGESFEDLLNKVKKEIINKIPRNS